MPRVSVIIPAHDAGEFLPETLRSVHAQTYVDWEVVAVDDGSSDDTWSILEGAGPRVRALRNPAPSGPAAARNRALAEATGELIVFLDADDLLLPRYLESQTACLEAARAAGRRVGIVTCDARLIEDGEYAAHSYLDTIRDRDKPLTFELVLKRNPIYIGSMVPKAVGDAVGWFDTELRGAADLSLWIKILERGFVAVRNPEAVAVYRRHHGSMSSDIGHQGNDATRAYELALERGGLNARQRRIVKRAIRYNRAMAAVARLRFAPAGDRRLREAMRLAPLLAWVAVTNPRWWSQWVAILRTGRQPPVGKMR